MNPLDNINQLNDEIALLRSQLSDARKQLEADSATIAKLAKDKRELLRSVRDLLDFADPYSVPGDITIEKWENAVSTYSRHA